jgi:V8-like Glu-specific endopeptidase
MRGIARVHGPARTRSGDRQTIRAPARARIGRAATARVMTVFAVGAFLFAPPGHGADRLAIRLAAALRIAPRHAVAAGRSRSFDGTPAVGALFTLSGGHLGHHFCTASVVHSRRGDLLLTAAHCMTGVQVGHPGDIVFVPAFHDGNSPYGAWRIMAVFVDRAWASRHDPDDDVAFLQADGQIEKTTGAELLGVGLPPQPVRVIGYPDGASRPITCQAWARAFGARQLVFDCNGYKDGSSGAPFLTDVSKATGRGTVIGVIGGYQQGGNTPDISYSSRFLANVAALYKSASGG